MKGKAYRDITRITYRLTVEHDAQRVTVDTGNKSGALSFRYSASSWAVAAALRDLAYYALERAADIEGDHTADGCKKQAEMMLEEHKSLFELLA